MAKSGVTKLKKRRDINIGIVIFLFIMVYVIINVYLFFTKSQIPLYEVQPGSLYSSVQRKGIIIREEKLFATNTAGYVNYYFREGARVAKHGTVYSIDSDRDIYDFLTGDEDDLKIA